MRTVPVLLLAAALIVGSPTVAAGQSSEGCVDEGCVVASFTGQLAFGMCGEVESPDVVCDEPAVLVAFSDPRLAGEVAITGWSREIGDTSVLWLGSWLIGSSEAGWVEVASPHLQFRDGTPTQYTSVLIGTGKYDGLSAVSEVTVSGAVFDFRGRLVPGGMEPGVPDYAGVIRSGDLAGLDW